MGISFDASEPSAISGQLGTVKQRGQGPSLIALRFSDIG
jgi:hypothetical protein